MFKLLFSVISLLVLPARLKELTLENLALRQQLAVMKRQRPRPRLRGTDRWFWVCLRRFWPNRGSCTIPAKVDIDQSVGTCRALQYCPKSVLIFIRTRGNFYALRIQIAVATTATRPSTTGNITKAGNPSHRLSSWERQVRTARANSPRPAIRRNGSR